MRLFQKGPALSERSESKGFTLIELLVVVLIIMILAGLVIVSVSRSRAKGRDAKRIADLSNIQLALEMYKDSKGNYPNIVDSWTNAYDTLSAITNFTKYLSPIPKDPINKADTNNVYKIIGDPATSTTSYWLSALFENPDNIPEDYKLGANCYQIWGGETTAGKTGYSSGDDYCD